jgi:acyl carrier protein
MGVAKLPPRRSWTRAIEDPGLPSYVRDKLAVLAALERDVERLHVYSGSLANRHALRRYFARVRAGLGPVRGVIHAAGCYSDASVPAFAAKPLEAMRRVWEPKVEGLENLYATLRGEPLDFFAALASMTALVPSLARGAADYAMANAFVEFFTAYQRQQRGDARCRSVMWSDWSETGAITRVPPEKAAAVAAAFGAMGLRTFGNREGCDLFDRALQHAPAGPVLVGFVDRERFAQASARLLHADPAVACAPRDEAHAALLRHLERWEDERRIGLEVDAARVSEVIGMDAMRALDPAVIHRIHAVLLGAPAHALAEPELENAVSATLMEVLKLKSVDRTHSFQGYGLDSISATVLATRLEKKLRRRVPPQWLIEHPTVEALARHLRSARATDAAAAGGGE